MEVAECWRRIGSCVLEDTGIYKLVWCAEYNYRVHGIHIITKVGLNTRDGFENKIIYSVLTYPTC